MDKRKYHQIKSASGKKIAIACRGEKKGKESSG